MSGHPLVAAWRFIEPLLFGQVYTNKQAIASHYNADPKLFLSFLDPVFPAYSGLPVSDTRLRVHRMMLYKPKEAAA